MTLFLGLGLSQEGSLVVVIISVSVSSGSRSQVLCGSEAAVRLARRRRGVSVFFTHCADPYVERSWLLLAVASLPSCWDFTASLWNEVKSFLMTF